MNAAERRRPDPSWRSRAQRLGDAFGYVLALVLLTYVLTSLVPDHGWTAVLLSLTISATSVVALASAHASQLGVRVAIWFALAGGLATVIGAVTGAWLWLNIGSAIEVMLLTVAMAAVLRRVVMSAGADSRTILGAISVYTVFGLLFTFLYAFIARVQGGPFFEGHPHAGNSDFIFFSYTTLTTTGFGDLVPRVQPGRMLAGLEMMIGQIFLVTLVAGLVSLWRPGERFRQRRGAAGGPVEGAPPASAGGEGAGP